MASLMQRIANKFSGRTRKTSGAATKNSNRSRSFFATKEGKRAASNAMRRKSTGGMGG